MAWCEVCQHGVPGDLGKPCPECISRYRDNPGILMTAEQAKANKKRWAEAQRLLRAKRTVKGQKTPEEIARDIKAQVIAEITQNYTLVPKPPKVIKTDEIKLPSVIEKAHIEPESPLMATKEVRIKPIKPVETKTKIGSGVPTKTLDSSKSSKTLKGDV